MVPRWDPDTGTAVIDPHTPAAASPGSCSPAPRRAARAEVLEALDLMDNGKKANMDLLLEIGIAVGRTYFDAAYPDPKFDLPDWRA